MRFTYMQMLFLLSVIMTFQTENVMASQSSAVLKAKDVWLIPEPKNVAETSGSFDIKKCKSIQFIDANSSSVNAVVSDLFRKLIKSSDVFFEKEFVTTKGKSILLAVCAERNLPLGTWGIGVDELKKLNQQGYILHIDRNGVIILANDAVGLSYGMRTLIQIAADRSVLPGLHIVDWPSLKFRGVQQDICRGQVPTMETFKRLTDVVAEAKMNVIELYIEHTFKFKSHPDIAPKESITAEEAREIFNYAARYNVEVHPLLQVLGHSFHTLKLPQYQHLRVGPCEKQPWIMTFDIRKPEAVSMVNELVDDTCQAFPGKYLNVDITEIDIEGFKASGATEEEVTELVYNYVLKLNKMVKRHDMRLIIAQGPLDSTGHLAGMGSKLDMLPRDIMIGCYYTAGGCYQPAWEKDFPRLHEKGFDFFAQAWINSHVRLMPWVGDAREFSDKEVARGLTHGAVGSITTDWGDDGHFHFVGQEWYPFVYHGASAWTGAANDREYFDQAFTRIFYGIPDDSVAKAIQLAGNISGQKVKINDATLGKVVENESYHFVEFFNDPFSDKSITTMADPVETGRQILTPADEAVRILRKAQMRASRNSDNIEQLLFGARCYQAMGNKLIMAGHSRDEKYPRVKLSQEISQVINVYTALKKDFEQLWLAEDRSNQGMQGNIKMFDNTIVPCQTKIKELESELKANLQQ